MVSYEGQVHRFTNICIYLWACISVGSHSTSGEFSTSGGYCAAGTRVWSHGRLVSEAVLIPRLGVSPVGLIVG